ncbi:MAG: bifunctional riboflavin kinase/FAD synthetase [Desulfurellaceae bacterium]|jgi:riboflavin kinase/FMN adenylyltransferase|nr:bifunctional riboflavin kinase/FAD synthetase [Desulfurellaceae bacterium]
MKVIRDLENLNFKRPVVVLGNFDGVHVGHQTLIKKVVKRAREIDGTSVVFTFYPHPLKVIKNESPPLIQTFREKACVVRELGVDVMICARFTKRFANIYPEEFIKQVLLDALRTREIYIGYDYTFGKNGKGTVDTLLQYSRKYHFKLYVIPPVRVKDIIASSNAVRELIKDGKIKEASLFLGRYYSVEGYVEKGMSRGKQLGFPTANMYPKNELLPKSGVYIAMVKVDEKLLHAVVNVGSNPTFGDDVTHLEAHILGFKGNIYNKRLNIEFVKRIRDEVKFKDSSALREQIELDIDMAEAFWQNKVIKVGEKR